MTTMVPATTPDLSCRPSTPTAVHDLLLTRGDTVGPPVTLAGRTRDALAASAYRDPRFIPLASNP
jgi:hypothetical protein